MIGDGLAQFHFLRPEWFYALVPAVALFFILRARISRTSNWEKTIDPELLPFLLDAPQAQASKTPLTLLLIAWILATLALAGPVWRKMPQPVHEKEDALVVILDLTRSMYSVDVKPDRLVQARHKLTDLLNERKEGVTGLIVFSGDAHAVSPLTDDAKTILAMVPSLAPEIMPAPGSDVTPALKRAYQLFQDGGASRGRILLITDEIRDRASAEALASEYKKQYPVSVLAVGTASGAPISADHLTANGGYLKDSNGNLVIPKVDFSSMQEFATAAGGRFSRMTLTDADLKYLLGGPQLPDDEFRTLERDFDVWFEEGPWLLLLLLPLGALAFRRGWLWCLLPLMVLMHSQPADASVWDDLWQTQDQQAAQAMRQGDARQAAQLFKNPAWKAAAQYRSKDYANAAKDFESIDTSDGHYNRGNALARQGKLKDAIEAYDKALAMNPDNQDATYNKKLVEQLLKKQQQQHKQQDKQGKNQQDKDKQKNGQGQQGENQKQQQGKQGKQGKQNPASQSGANQQAQQEKGDNQKQGQAGEQQDAQKKKAREEQARQAKAAKDKQKGEKQRQAPADNDNLSEEQRQALQQWLRRVPDDPGGLLRRKFAQQHQQRLQNGESEPDDSKNNW